MLKRPGIWRMSVQCARPEGAADGGRDFVFDDHSRAGDDGARHQRRALVHCDVNETGAVGVEHRLAVRRYRIWFLAATSAVVGMFSTDHAIADLSAAALVTECDRLAAAPTDPNREGPGVALDRIDRIAAIDKSGLAERSGGYHPAGPD
jgi:hypothetical protein